MTLHAPQNSALVLYRKLAGEDSPIAASWGMLAFRWWGVLMLALTYYKTQFAWGPRVDDFPPVLPLWDGSPVLPQLDLYWPLMLTLALVPFIARLGLILHSITLAYAIITDLTRIQPECFSPVILLWATLPSDNARTIARAHLAAMWFFAGFHKLMAPAFQLHVGPEIFTHLLKFHVEPETAHKLGILVAVTEMAVGLGVLFPLTRRIAAIAAIGMHFVIFIGATSIPEGMDQLVAGNYVEAKHALNPSSWYQPVWPWNLLLMWAGLAFFWNEPRMKAMSWRRLGWIAGSCIVLLLAYFLHESIWPWNLLLAALLIQGNWIEAETIQFRPLWHRIVMASLAAVLIISPLGYYPGWVNPYLANCIYTGNFIRGYRLPANPTELSSSVQESLAEQQIPLDKLTLGSETSRPSREKGMNISLPPSERMFQRYFAKTGKPHERMILYYPGWMSLFTGIQEREFWLGHGEKINGLAEGPWIFYDDAGKKSTEVTFRHGQQNGPCINWRPDGSKESEGPMQDNQLHGQWKFYDPEGTVTATFRNGVRVE